MTLVQMNLSTNRLSPICHGLLHQVDQLIYKLYDLTEEEIKIIEGASLC